MKIGQIEVGRKAIRKRTPTLIKKVGDWLLLTSTILGSYTVAVLTDPLYFKLMTLYIPPKYTSFIAVICGLLKVISMFTGRKDEKPIYPAPEELKKNPDEKKP